MKRNSLVHISVDFWQSGRTEKRLIKSILFAHEAFQCKRIATKDVMSTELFKTFGIHYFNRK